jgi:anaerobic selenocysteine-containing dehydrogenase
VSEPRTALQTCPLCEAACGLSISIKDGQPVRVRGDAADPQSLGYICPKGASLIALHDDLDRLQYPLVRRGTNHVEVSWEEALSLTDQALSGFLVRHGNERLATYIGNPAAHNLSVLLYSPHVVRAARSRYRFSSGSVDTLPKMFSSAAMFGHGYSMTVPDVDRTDYLLVLGANPLVSNGSLLTAPDMAGRLKAIQARGGRVVVVDPRRTKTAEAADEHIFIRPATDVWLLGAIVRTLFAEDLVDLGRCGGHVAGLDVLAAAVEKFHVKTASDITGVPGETIVRLARQLAAAPTAAVYGRIGTCLQEHGTVCCWLIDVINLLTGNLDSPGGAVFTMPLTERARDAGGLRSEQNQHGRYRGPATGLPEMFGELPAAALAREILTPGDQQIRGLIVVAGNPALSVPGSGPVADALADLDLLICVDNYLNETTCHADIILPGESQLQRPHFPFIARWSLRRYARWTAPALAPEPGRPREWELMLALAAILDGIHPPFGFAEMDDDLLRSRVAREVADPASVVYGRHPEEIVRSLSGQGGPERTLDFLLRVGREGDGFGSRPGGLTLAELAAQPHGVDLGPLEPQLPGMIATESRLIEAAPPPLVGALDRLTPPPDGGQDSRLLLIGRRNLRSNNSWMHNLPTLVRGRPQCTLQMNPSDGARLGIADGQVVEVTSDQGRIQVQAEMTDMLTPGVACLPHGWGHDQPGSRLRVAAASPGANSNLLGGAVLDEVTGTAVSSGIPVSVAATPAADFTTLPEENLR